MATATKKNPKLWKQVVARIKAGAKGGRAGQWSARKAQLAVSAYKKAGGSYAGSKKQTDLSKWTKQIGALNLANHQVKLGSVISQKKQSNL
jgi:hypothetical protein